MNKIFNKEVNIPVGKVTLKGQLVIPLKAKAIIIFSYGNGAGRFNKRCQQVAEYLHQKNFGTLLFDLLTEEEDKYYYNRFNIDLLAKRLAGATEWLENLPDTKDLRIGYFGAGIGAASALQAAAQLNRIDAVVSKDGRPDLVIEYLLNVQAPVLLIAGNLDYEVLEVNKTAYEKLNCEKKLEVIEDATHLFKESKLLNTVAKQATEWFEKYLQNEKSLKRSGVEQNTIKGMID